MGCSSSTQVVVDPITGEAKKKKKLGGAYPGQRPPQHEPYTPSASEFDSKGTAVAHFVAYGGGNALTLIRNGSVAPETVGKAQPEYIQVTLPDGVKAGQTIHVQAPDGRRNAITIPPGFGPGSTFTVQFSDAPAPAPYATAPAPYAPATAPYAPATAPYAPATAPYAPVTAPSVAAAPMYSTNNAPSNRLDPGGFASVLDGPSTSAAGYGDYPTSTATPIYTSPVYSPPPQYPSY